MTNQKLVRFRIGSLQAVDSPATLGSTPATASWHKQSKSAGDSQRSEISWSLIPPQKRTLSTHKIQLLTDSTSHVYGRFRIDSCRWYSAAPRPIRRAYVAEPRRIARQRTAM